MKAFIFPGQGSQSVGMGKELYEQNSQAKALFEQANRILGFELTQIMFEGTEEQLKTTAVTQPAVFVQSAIMAICSAEKPDMVAGHSLGEFSALVANQCLSFEDGLRLVAMRANAMQKACELQKSTMAAILGAEDSVVEQICEQISQEGEIVVAANYNSPAQVVISGTVRGVAIACERLKAAGAKRAVELAVGGAFHSPLMASAKSELEKAIQEVDFRNPICPIYQNVDAQAYQNPEQIKANLIAQLTSPVRWTQSVENMFADGARTFVEVGNGKVLQALVKKIAKDAQVASL